MGSSVSSLNVAPACFAWNLHGPILSTNSPGDYFSLRHIGEATRSLRVATILIAFGTPTSRRRMHARKFHVERNESAASMSATTDR
jgi:hypothetical protein